MSAALSTDLGKPFATAVKDEATVLAAADRSENTRAWPRKQDVP